MVRVHFILGCTAGGKGAVGRELARRTGGHVISVDSMKVYRRMDIGTAKPTPAQRAEIPHHCIDIVEPSESFSVARYLQCADQAIARVAAGGAVVLAVGGTALYIKALSEGLFEGPGADPAIRARLRARARKEGLAALHAELGRVDPHAAGRIHPNDEKRIIRALEVFELTGRPISRLQRQWDARRRRYECVFIGLRRSRQDTNRRINARVKRMIEMGLREEVATLLAEPKGLSPQAAQALGYAEMIRHLRGQCSLEEAVEQIKINTRQFAKQQRTWFRRFADVHWIDVAEDDSVEKTADAAMRFVQGS
ncbi:MAG: tRNA (adenosine(37)-N6)-dimethylallyltransferase MiaA [Planctomycetales bacterium 4484_123]|nr:MAG: tRNA (adenosine(37)-N6)-dimethylallyltransferase MiaA [Planctomycetales bacterium 4484_123]